MSPRNAVATAARFVSLLAASSVSACLFMFTPKAAEPAQNESESEEGEHKLRPRSPQAPYRLCVPPGIPDAPPFAYTSNDPDSTYLPARRGESGTQADHPQSQAVQDDGDAGAGHRGTRPA